MRRLAASMNTADAWGDWPAAMAAQPGKRKCRDCGGPDPHSRCGSCCECYCSEPSCGDQAYTGICQGCGGYEECYCNE